MRHRLQRKVFAGGENRSSSPQESRTPSTFTIKQPLSRNPHSTKQTKLHSKSTYFYRWGSSHKLSSSLSYVVPSVCGLALLVGGIVTINPILSNIEKANAEELIITQADIAPTISLTLTDGEAYQQTTTTVDTVTYRSNTFNIGGTGIFNYEVSLNTPNGKTGKLVGKKNPYITVEKVATNTTPDNFDDNTWGYAISERNKTSSAEFKEEEALYNPVPSGTDSSNNSIQLAKRIGLSKSTIVDDNYKITFAAKLSNNLPSDHYETDVYLSVVSSAQATISNITTMQEMDHNVCKTSVEYETKQLTDTRDNKIYWVTKFKDGNCWMTQNLAYNGGGNRQCTITNGKCSGWPATENSDGKPRYAIGAHTNGDHSSQGNYYSWEAAANGNICPDGWQLPTIDTYQSLTKSYNLGSNAESSNKFRAEPFYFVYSGYFYNEYLYDGTSTGLYWSSTTNSENSSITQRLNSVGVYSSSENKNQGASVRCIAK